MAKMETNYGRAVKAAELCIKAGGVLKIWLVGDMASTGDSKEAIQIILGVHRNVFEDYCSRIDNYIKACLALETSDDKMGETHIRHLRYWSSQVALRRMKGKITLPELMVTRGTATPELDILMMRFDWQDYIAEMQEAFHLQDSNGSMISHFAKTAHLYDEGLETFVDKEGEPLDYPLER